MMDSVVVSRAGLAPSNAFLIWLGAAMGVFAVAAFAYAIANGGMVSTGARAKTITRRLMAIAAAFVAIPVCVLAVNAANEGDRAGAVVSSVQSAYGVSLMDGNGDKASPRDVAHLLGVDDLTSGEGFTIVKFRGVDGSIHQGALYRHGDRYSLQNLDDNGGHYLKPVRTA